jgi:hypothetical protein
MSTIITIPVQIEIPDGMSVESVAICQNGNPIAFTPEAMPRPWHGRWENLRQYKMDLRVVNWKETLTEVKR